jgi:predicted transcriptional regulator
MEGQRPYTVDDLLSQLAEQVRAQRIREDEFTVKQFAEKLGCTRSSANRQLEALMREGRVTRRPIVDGYDRWAYRVVE